MSVLLALVLAAAADQGGARPSGRSGTSGDVDGESLAREFQDAYKAAQGGDRLGFQKLYRIAAAALSAEISESARDALAELLYSRPGDWVRSLAGLERAELERYLAHGGLAPLELPEGISSPAQFEQEVVSRLQRLRVKGRQASLVAFVIRYYRQHPSGKLPEAARALVRWAKWKPKWEEALLVLLSSLDAVPSQGRCLSLGAPAELVASAGLGLPCQGGGSLSEEIWHHLGQLDLAARAAPISCPICIRNGLFAGFTRSHAIAGNGVPERV